MTDKATVTVSEGKIRGLKKKSNFSGEEYCCFLGVPYGQPPIEHNRFKDPIAVKPWDGILDATIEKEGCSQFSVFEKEIVGSEDCLYNNIYVPKLPVKGTPLKPVIVNLHPGGFIFGSPDPKSFGSPEFVMHHDIVYVTVAFRLHILGFLNLGLKECSGNQTFKDMILSLKWIKKNISAFGGDPNNITLMGTSSGSLGAHLLMLSPQSKDLFHKAVLMGMYAFNPTIIVPGDHTKTAFEIAKSLGYVGTEENKKNLLVFLKTVSIDNIILMKLDSLITNCQVPVFPGAPFGPTSDLGKNSVLPLPPQEMIHLTTKIPLMIGFCDREAAMIFIRKMYKHILSNGLYSVVTQNRWGWGYNLTDEDLKKIKMQSEMFYLDGKLTENSSSSDKCDILTDMALSDVYDSLINIVSEDHPSVYVYKFNFEGSAPKVKDALLDELDEPLKGTVHADDYSYWSLVKGYKKRGSHIITPKSREIIEKFTKLICTFAKTGDPNYKNLEVQWKASTLENPCYLKIDDKLELIDGKLNGKRMEFWEDLKKQF